MAGDFARLIIRFENSRLGQMFVWSVVFFLEKLRQRTGKGLTKVHEN
jgi:hypothetical protein